MLIRTCEDRPILNPCTLKDLYYQIDPYIGCGHYCHYCYVLNQAETDWTKEILIHKDIVGRLERELKDIPPQTIYLGWQTDPYQPCEAQIGQTRQVLALLLEKGFSASILTKSDLVLHDLDLLQDMDAAAVSVSVAFNDERVRQLFEANTAKTEARITALRQCKAAGVKTSALICPVIPYITKVMSLIDRLAPHADKIWIYGLSILERSDPNWQNVEKILKDHYPDLKEPIETVIFSKDHGYWTELRQDLESIQNEKKLNFNIHV
jgi:DNA repair photolyase